MSEWSLLAMAEKSRSLSRLKTLVFLRNWRIYSMLTMLWLPSKKPSAREASALMSCARSLATEALRVTTVGA
jgi:hypothetical protein